MKNIIHKICELRLFVFCLCFSGIGPVVANESSEGNETVTTEVAFFPLGGASWRGLYFTPENENLSEIKEIRFNALSRTEYMPYSGPAKLSIFTKGRCEEGRETFVSIGSVRLDKSAARQILLVEESSSSLAEMHPEYVLELPGNLENHLRAFVFVDSLQTFPVNSVVFFNTMGAEFFGIFGEERISLKPGLNRPVDINRHTDTNIRVGLAVHDGERNRRVLDSSYRFSPERRTLIVLRRPENNGSYRIRAQRLTEYLGEG